MNSITLRPMLGPPLETPLVSRYIGRRQAVVSIGLLSLVCAAPGVTRTAAALEKAAPAAASARKGLSAPLFEESMERAAALPRLRALLIAQNGEQHAAHAFRGPGLDDPVNIKSVSKSVMSALVGVAIERGILASVDQPIAPILDDLVPADADPRIGAVTVGHLLSMRAGLERTSGRNYGRWINSPNWVRYVLSRPFVDEPGGRMLYSTGSYHLLSAMLTRAAGRSTLALARTWIGEPLGVDIPPWTRDPQGVYLGGNNMALSPRALLRFGEMYRRQGVWHNRRVLSEGWIQASWTPRTRSRFTGHSYGYGWFMASARGHRVYYAWGYGGQLVYIVPDLALTVVVTSELSSSPERRRHVRQVHTLFADSIVRAAERGTG